MTQEADLEHQLEELIKNSAQKAVGGVGKFAVALSGGIDSGLLAALTGTRHAVTVHLPYGEVYDEFSDAQNTAAELRIENHLIITPEHERFDEVMRKALLLIERTTEHFSLFPLYLMFERLAQEGFESLVFGDGPDESMCGYVRCIMMDHIYNAPKAVETFTPYESLFVKALPWPWETYAKALDRPLYQVRPLMVWEPLLRGICKVEMSLTRLDVGGICDIFGNHFGIRILRPYMAAEVDEFMFNLPDDCKIRDHWGKYLLRRVAARYVPLKVVWRRRKMGGPVYPVNRLQGWMEKGEFDKTRYRKYQKEILSSFD
ncbi:MAG: asparagine synthase C-terminal domain-containing protein [Patescibacteria group bacterium]